MGRVEEKAEGLLWRGHRVKVVDGSSVSMPDTPENQKKWPQPKAQKPGCGFPVMRIVAMFSLATGAVLDLAGDALSIHERLLFKRLWSRLEKGDVALADRGFCSFADIYCLLQIGVESVMRKHQARSAGQTTLKKLGKNDLLVQWTKTLIRPAWLTIRQWREMPQKITLRQIKAIAEIPGFRSQTIIIVTTLIDHKKYPAKAFSDLYRRRWRAELYLRDIKTTMEMEVLRCKSPQMAEKELWMKLIAYNLVRAIMIEAAQKYEEPVETISFKQTISTIRQWSPYLARPDLNRQQRTRLYKLLLYYLAENKLPRRPNRVEPRAKKRRPKSYQYLTKPRKIFKEIPHKEKYRKA